MSQEVRNMRLSVLLILVSLMSSLAIAETVGLRRAFYDEAAMPGDVVPVLVSVRNFDDRDARDVQVRLESPDYGLLDVSQEADIDEGESFTFWLFVEVPYDAKGEMPFSITVIHDDEARRYYRWLIV
jgi:predicted nucleic acid-binding protein